ncbi:MAG: sensor histidine kinase [Roseovarius sp.]|nr:sensor histidine kinase [Roseovarius sp.]
MAQAGGVEMRERPPRKGGFLLPEGDCDAADRAGGEPKSPARRGWLMPRSSPLTRRIVTFNLIALNVLVIGILYLDGAQVSLVARNLDGLHERAMLTADALAARLAQSVAVNLPDDGNGMDVPDMLRRLTVHEGTDLFLFAPSGELLGRKSGDFSRARSAMPPSATPSAGFMARLRSLVSPPAATGPEDRATDDLVAGLRQMAARSLAGGGQAGIVPGAAGAVPGATVPVLHGTRPVAVMALADTSGEIARLAAAERERVFRMFLIATLISIGFSLVLASTIANPLADLAAATEIGREHNRGAGAGGRIRIPDLSARSDEIGQLSGALRGMVAALCNRIESNEQFAADVAHEIKNPLASLRSAVGAMRIARRADQRERLLEVIEHDVRRLDRLVSDISNASRLDSELVRDAKEPFDLGALLRNLGDHLGEAAGRKGIDVITDFPEEPVWITGLEARLAQVFVNLVTNAISFCGEGDAIRVWLRRRANRVLVVVEDTGPGIPPEALEKVFQRFYSERPEGDFGNNSGLGLAISKRIVEAHDGVIWAENIHPTEADPTSDPLGARFVVGLRV